MRLNSIICDAKTASLLARGKINQLYRLIEPIPNHPVRYDGREFSTANSSIEMETTTRHWWEEVDDNEEPTENYIGFDCPYGAAGDLLWVKEPWVNIDDEIFFERDLLLEDTSIDNNNLSQLIETIGWQTSGSLQFANARILLRVNRIIVLKVNDKWLWALSIRVL